MTQFSSCGGVDPTLPGKALDGNETTTWKSGCKSLDAFTGTYTHSGEFVMDLGKVHTLGRIVVKPEKFQYFEVWLSLSATGFSGTHPNSFLARDDLVALGTTSSQEGAIYFDGVGARHIFVIANNFNVGSEDYVEINEIEVYQVVEPPTFTKAFAPAAIALEGTSTPNFYHH